MLPKLGLLAFYLLQQLQAERILQRQEIIARGSRPVNFAYIYESGFYPHYDVWTSMAPLFERMEGVDSPLCLSWHCLGYLSTTHSKRSKVKDFRFPLWFLSYPVIPFLNLCSLYPSNMNLHVPGITGFIGIFLF